jgi:hypothetical protein
MMKTEARLALSLRQRRFEWALARDEQTRTAASIVAGKTHDLLNLIQIIRLASGTLEQRCDPRGREIVQDIARTAEDSHRSFTELMAIARPAETVVRGAPVRAAVEAAVAALRDVLALDARIDAPPASATRCTAAELEHLVIGLVLDAADAPASAAQPVELAVREREISGAPWIELVRGGAAVPGDRFELRVVEEIARRAGGELSTSARRGGGEDVIVALPEVGPRPT